MNIKKRAKRKETLISFSKEHSFVYKAEKLNGGNKNMQGNLHSSPSITTTVSTSIQASELENVAYLKQINYMIEIKGN